MQKGSSVATTRGRALASAGASALCVCVCSWAQSLLLPLAIVSECAGKLTAYLCRAARDQQASDPTPLNTEPKDPAPNCSEKFLVRRCKSLYLNLIKDPSPWFKPFIVVVLLRRKYKMANTELRTKIPPMIIPKNNLLFPELGSSDAATLIKMLSLDPSILSCRFIKWLYQTKQVPLWE